MLRKWRGCGGLMVFHDARLSCDGGCGGVDLDALVDLADSKVIQIGPMRDTKPLE